jgi:hypothetical protein
VSNDTKGREFKNGNWITKSSIIDNIDIIKKKLLDVPEVLILKINEKTEDNEHNKYENLIKHYFIDNKNNINNLLSNKEEILYNNNEYILDSVLLSNYNDNLENNHQIVGVKCDNKKYVYNGWTSYTNDPAMKNKLNNLKTPCDLMEFEWNIKNSKVFCLNDPMCKLDIVDINHNNLCFSFSKGERFLVYVKKNIVYINTLDIPTYTPNYFSLFPEQYEMPQKYQCLKNSCRRTTS